MGRIESFASPEPSGTACPTVPHFAPPVGADASPKGGEPCQQMATECVGEGRHSLSDSDRERAICRASELVEYLHSLYRFHEAIWRRDGCFHHKAAFDQAYADCHKAREILESLERGKGS